jgi:hypothetical protein
MWIGLEERDMRKVKDERSMKYEGVGRVSFAMVKDKGAEIGDVSGVWNR